VEIRIFESKLDANIAHLQQQMLAYAQDVVHTDHRLHFKFPKSDTQLRPLGLSRIEEEILSTALIQKLGQKISGIASRSYAYKFSRTYGEQSTEYLYENWFDAYGRFMTDVRFAAQNSAGCIIIQTDIKSFYTRIIRDNLIQFSADQLSRSARIEWLLKVLFARDIDEHEAGKGIVQGNIASGFFANLYLIDLDAHFGPGNEWNVEFFRYVDDMIIVVPDPENAEVVLAELENELHKLGLELNRDKTEIFTDIAEFIEITNKDETLDSMQIQFQGWLNCLWILDIQYRQVFRKAYDESSPEWWYKIELYSRCLKAIGVNIDATLLSRRVYKYLFNERLCEKDFSWQESFQIPPLPDSMEKDSVTTWKVGFVEANDSWVIKKTEMSDVFHKLLMEGRNGLADAIDNGDTRSEKRWIKTIRFCINKLVQIGLQNTDIAQIIFEILIDSPWLIRNPNDLTESLAICGYSDHIESLLLHYDDESDQMKEYMKSIVLRAIRFLPFVSDAMWVQIVENAVSVSSVTSLMATETWLKVTQDQPNLVQDNHLELIESALNSKPKPILRLQKNYLLILGEHHREVAIEKEDKQDVLLQNVEAIVQSENVYSLFDYYEPQLLTREFYSGYRTDEGITYPSPI